MRGLLCLVLVAGGCASEPSIACSTDEQCLDGQQCSSGWCTPAGTSSMMSDGGTSEGDAPPSSGDAALPDAPATCSPACTGETPHCLDGTCMECIGPLDCPLIAPRCVANACTI